MKKLFILCISIIPLLIFGTEKMEPICTVAGELNKLHGHLQGACASDDAIYFGYPFGIFKLDWQGKVVKHVSAPNHTGDVCFYNGKVYSSVAYYDKKRAGKGAIKEYSADLKELRTYELDYPCDGITAFDGFIYAGIGPNPQKAHRGNRIIKISADFTGKPEIINIDHGYHTHFGVQGMTADDQNIYMCFYGAQDPAVKRKQKNIKDFAVYSKDFKLLNTLVFSGSIGFGILPPKFKSENPQFFRVRSLYNYRKKETPRFRLDFFEYVNGKRVKISK